MYGKNHDISIWHMWADSYSNYKGDIRFEYKIMVAEWANRQSPILMARKRLEENSAHTIPLLWNDVKGDVRKAFPS